MKIPIRTGKIAGKNKIEKQVWAAKTMKKDCRDKTSR